MKMQTIVVFPNDSLVGKFGSEHFYYINVIEMTLEKFRQLAVWFMYAGHFTEYRTLGRDAAHTCRKRIFIAASI